jgi:hypothetical protein
MLCFRVSTGEPNVTCTHSFFTPRIIYYMQDESLLICTSRCAHTYTHGSLCSDDIVACCTQKVPVPHFGWVTVEMTALWDTVQCSFIAVHRRFRDAYCCDDGSSMHLRNVCILYETTRRNVSEGCHLHTLRRENLKYHLGYCLSSLSGFLGFSVRENLKFHIVKVVP